jgi:8-oxo-dGTP pyrophosphatase MutT (NUDIX family)
MNQVSPNPIVQRARRLFGETACRLQVAAMPWRRTADGIEIMLITSRDTGRWVLPKGWPERGEDFWHAAAREAGEEAGLTGIVEPREVGRYFYAKARADGDEVPCEVMVYPLEVTAEASKWKERGERTRQWMPAHEAAGQVAEIDLGELIEAFAAAR